jgi:hypothetical protein
MTSLLMNPPLKNAFHLLIPHVNDLNFSYAEFASCAVPLGLAGSKIGGSRTAARRFRPLWTGSLPRRSSPTG